jgi:pyruvate dehydrogenase E1 component alpha subunit
MTDAVEKALDPTAEERRPTLIEAVQYRFGAHTTADDPTVYRDDEERERWERRDPLPRMETFLRERGLLDDQHKENMETAIEELLNQLVETAESYDPDPAWMFDHSHATAPPRVRAQRESFQRLRERHGDEALTRDD